MPQREVFISYSHRDKGWKDRLVEHLAVLETEGLLTIWNDRRIAAGDDGFAEIERALADARVAVLLVTRHFLSSDSSGRSRCPTCWSAGSPRACRSSRSS